MYLSLKGSLGHTAITDRVGESLLQIAEGSSAAYSLRNLGSDSPSVVRVRRESDNAERDFSAQDINTSVVENWVNQQIIPPLDLRELTPTGRDGPLIPAAAAYSLRNLSNSYTGNVVEVRRTSDDQVRSFTAVEVSDGTLLNWVNTDVDKLDLQAGSLDAFITNETATGFDFSVNSEGSNKFKGLLPTASIPAGNYTVTLDVALNSGSLTGCNLFHTDGSGVITPLTTGANSLNLTSDAASDIFFYILGTAVADVSITNITLTQTTADGHVSTWYDQSGNGNNASQLTASNQPKIVDAGVLVLSNGNAAIKSTAGNLMTFSMASLSADGQQSVFSVLENDVTSQDNFSSVVSALSNSDGLNGVNRRPRWFIGPDGRLVFSVDSLSGYSTANRERRLYSHIMEDTAGGTSTIYQDGTQVDTRSITLDANPNFILAQVGVVGTNAVGALYMSEVIYYPSDQSDNRTAFEANIGEVYGIAGIPAYDNTVNGFVETWSDQSSSVVTNYDPYPSSQFQTSGNTAYWSATSTAGTDGTGWDLVSDLGNDSTNNFGSLLLHLITQHLKYE